MSCDLQPLINTAEEVMQEIDRAGEVLRVEATKMGIEPVQLRDTRGGFPYHEILKAKAEAMRAHAGYLKLKRLLEEDTNARS